MLQQTFNNTDDLLSTLSAATTTTTFETLNSLFNYNVQCQTLNAEHRALWSISRARISLESARRYWLSWKAVFNKQKIKITDPFQLNIAGAQFIFLHCNRWLTSSSILEGRFEKTFHCRLLTVDCWLWLAHIQRPKKLAWPTATGHFRPNKSKNKKLPGHGSIVSGGFARWPNNNCNAIMSNNKIKKAREGKKKVAVKAEVEASSRVIWKLFSK